MQYRSRPYSDLVDEDKHGFVARRYLSTLLGGYRIVRDEESKSYIGIGLHVAQVLIILIPPAIVLALQGIEDRITACAIGGGVLLLLNCLFMTGACMIKPETEEIDDEQMTCTQAYLFLFPKK